MRKIIISILIALSMTIPFAVSDTLISYEQRPCIVKQDVMIYDSGFITNSIYMPENSNYFQCEFSGSCNCLDCKSQFIRTKGFRDYPVEGDNIVVRESPDNLFITGTNNLTKCIIN
jgi:hypothetical protein